MDGLFSPSHIILILIAALVIFGPKRLPDIGKSLGKGIKEFKGAMSHIADDVEPTPPPPPAVTPNAGAAPAPATPPPAAQPPAPPAAAPSAQVQGNGTQQS